MIIVLVSIVTPLSLWHANARVVQIMLRVLVRRANGVGSLMIPNYAPRFQPNPGQKPKEKPKLARAVFYARQLLLVWFWVEILSVSLAL